MEKKKKKIWIIGGLVLCLVAVIGITFAFFSTGGTQDTANTFTSGCLNIELTDASSSINLTNTYPISDVEGVDSTSYDFTIRNTCDTSTNYSINLESLNEVANTLNADYIKVSLSSNTVDNVISKLSDNIVTTPELDGDDEAYTLYTGNLGAHEEKNYHLKLWIDYDATVEQAANKTYTSKINVIANPETEVVDTLEATFTLDDKTLTSSLSDNVTSATYCTTTTNICEPTTTTTITNNSYTVELEENENNQMVCTKLNGTSKVICSNSLEVKLILGGEYILAHYQTVLTRTSFSSTVTNTTTGTIYKSANESQYDDFGEVYYFAGNPTDNWVKWAGFYWRIIRINGNGSIRMIYQGTSPNTTGTGTQLQTSVFNASPNYDRSEYVGLKYTKGEQHGQNTNSTIMGVLETWYNSNLSSYADDIDTNVGFCSDRNMASGSSWSSQPSSTIYYAAYGRLVQSSSNANPSYKCSNSSDLLKIPIGLITVDETVYAGLAWSSGNSSNYLYTGEYYWTMSPYSFDATYSSAYVFLVWSDGNLDIGWMGDTDGVRPVINIRADVFITGSGTTTDPFVVVGAS